MRHKAFSTAFALLTASLLSCASIKKGYDIHFDALSPYAGSADYQEGKVIKENESYRCEAHWVKHNGNNIYCEYVYPADAPKDSPLPTVLLVHGFASNHLSWSSFLPYFAGSSFLAVALDCRGGSSFSFSDGDFLQMSLDTELADIEAVALDALNQPIVDKENFFLVGHSQGGLLVSLASAKKNLKDRLKGIVSLSGGYCLIDDIVLDYEESSLPETAEILGTKVGKGYLESVFHHRIYREEIKDYDGKALLLVGEEDELVSPDSVQGIYEGCYADKGEFHRLPGIGHGYSIKGVGTFYDSILEPFLQ